MYKIIGADKKEYGPISADQLRQWIAEGRVNAQTQILAEGATEWRTLSELPEFAASIPTAPPPGMAAAPMTSPAAQDQVNGPAIGLIITGALNILLSIARGAMTLMGIGMNAVQTTQGNAPGNEILKALSAFGLLFGICGILGGLVILFGGIKMRKLESYGLAMTASIVAMIPCLSACCLVGLPIGIWAVVVLSKPEVKDSFH